MVDHLSIESFCDLQKHLLSVSSYVCSYVYHATMLLHTVWPENLTGIKFDEIASKLHNKNMMDFNLTKCAVRRHIV